MKTICHPVQLAADLRQVASIWEIGGESSLYMFKSGICMALEFLVCGYGRERGQYYDSYEAIGALLALVQNRWAEEKPGWLKRLLDSGHWNWDDRAFMCLFMAEWLETDFIGKGRVA